MTTKLDKEIVLEQDNPNLSEQEAMAKAKGSNSIQDRINFVFLAAIAKAEKEGDKKDMRNKLDPFYRALKEGGEMVGLNGQWYALVAHNVSGWSKWAMRTGLYHTKLTNGNDGCRYYAAYCNQ